LAVEKVALGSGVARRRKGQTAPSGNQEGVAKVGVIRQHQASQDFWGRKNCSLPRVPITHATLHALGVRITFSQSLNCIQCTSKFTTASHGFLATARLSCPVWWSCWASGSNVSESLVCIILMQARIWRHLVSSPAAAAAFISQSCPA